MEDRARLPREATRRHERWRVPIFAGVGLFAIYLLLAPHVEPCAIVGTASAIVDVQLGRPHWRLYGELLPDEAEFVKRYQSLTGLSVLRVADCVVDICEVRFSDAYNMTLARRMHVRSLLDPSLFMREARPDEPIVKP